MQIVVGKTKSAPLQRGDRGGGRRREQGNLRETSVPRTPLALGGTTAPSVGNAGKPAREESQGCWDRHRALLTRMGGVPTEAPVPWFTPVVISQKLVNVCLPLRRQPLKTLSNLTSTHTRVLLPAAGPGDCINRRTQTWPSAVKCEMQEPHEEEMSERGHCILSPCHKLLRQRGSLEIAQQGMTDLL